MTNFLFINPTNTRVKRQAGTLIDNVIVMDGSGSVGNCEFERGKAAIKNMMKSANAVAVENKYDEKYAAVTFSSSASVNFKFLPYSTAEQKLTMIQFPVLPLWLHQYSSRIGRGNETVCGISYRYMFRCD